VDAGVPANGLSDTAREAGVHLLRLPATGVSMSLEFERSACAALVQCLPDAVLLVDGDLRVVLANRAAAALFRLNPERLRGLPVISLVTQPDFEHWLRDFGSRGTKVMEASLPGRGRGRTPMTVRITAVPMALAMRRRGAATARRRDYRLVVVKDISDTAVLEAQLVDSEKQGAMGQLAAGILHEVRNPVSSMGSNLCFVRDRLPESTDRAVTQALDVSLEYLDQMRQLLGTLSGFPRRAAPRYEIADLQDLIRRAVAFVAREAERRKIQLTAAFAPGPITCEMDARVIKQVLLNLLRNAMEAMPDGGRLDVRTSFRPPDPHSPAVVLIEIADSGVGIVESDLRRVFRPLFTTKPRGAGLGLSFCRQAVEEHGGEIHLMSRGRDRGTVALVSLPIRQPIND
jgi:signal transduction histidine kinase